MFNSSKMLGIRDFKRQFKNSTSQINDLNEMNNFLKM